MLRHDRPLRPVPHAELAGIGSSSAPVTVTLTRPRRARVGLGSTLRRPRHRRRPQGVGLVRLAIGSLVTGLVLGLIVAWQQATSPTTILLLGGSILAWSMLSFGIERPK